MSAFVDKFTLKKLHNKKNTLTLLIILFLAFIYFSYGVTISQDSTDYYKYLEIFNGNEAFKNWSIIRGPMMPITLFIIFSIFGNNIFGFLLGTFISYLILIFIGYKILLIFNKDKNDLVKKIIWIFFIILLVFNPLIIGYYHAMLTEFIATTLILLSCYLGYKFIDAKNGTKEFYLLVLSFMILSSFMWLLKQPYFFAVFFALLISVVLSIIKNRTAINFMFKSISIFSVLLFTFLSIGLWNQILLIGGARSTNEQSASFIADGIVAGISRVRKEATYGHDTINVVIDQLNKISGFEMIPLVDDVENDAFWNIYSVRDESGNIIIDFFILKVKNEKSLSISETKKFLDYIFKKHPTIILDSYVANYLTIANIYTALPTNHGYAPLRILSNYNHENDFYGLMQYNRSDTYWWSYAPIDIEAETVKYSIKNMSQFERINNPNFIAKVYSRLTSGTSLILFKILILISPFVLFFIFVKYFEDALKNRNIRLQKISEILIILYGVSFLYTIFFTVIGAIIDRYVFPIYPGAIIALILTIKYIQIYRSGDVNEKKS